MLEHVVNTSVPAWNEPQNTFLRQKQPFNLMRQPNSGPKMPGKRSTPYDYHDTATQPFVRKSKKEAEEQQQARRDGDCLPETVDSRQACHDELCLSELVGSWHSTSWLKAEPVDTPFRVGSSLSSVDTSAYGSTLTVLSVASTTAYGLSEAWTSSSIGYSGKERAGIIAHNPMGVSGELDRDSETNPNAQYKIEQPCNLETPNYLRYMVYRDSDTSAQPTPSILHTDDSEWSMGPGSPPTQSVLHTDDSELSMGSGAGGWRLGIPR